MKPVFRNICIILTMLFLVVSASASNYNQGFVFRIRSEENKTAVLDRYDGYETIIDIPGEVTLNSSTYKVTAIADYAFSRCKDITSVTIPNTVTYIGSGVFMDCASLSSVTIPESVTDIGASTFANCSSLQKISLTKGLKAIYGTTFSDCKALTNIELPDSLTYIGSGAFQGCSSLSFVIIPDNVTHIDYGAFLNCSSLPYVTIPGHVKFISQTAFSGCSAMSKIFVYSENEYYSSIDGILYNKDASELIYCPPAKSSVTIPSSVKTIDSSAFNGCSSISSLTIPSSVITIGEAAFTTCTCLKEINVDPENEYYSSTDGILYNKDASKLLSCPGGKINVTIPGTVK